MPRFAYLSRSIIVTGLLYVASCSGRGHLSGAGGTSGTGGAAGEPSDASDGTPITSCPASLKGTVPCSGTFACTFQTSCTCHGCCSGQWSCVAGFFQQTDYNDGCNQGPACPDAGPDADGTPITSCPASSPMLPPNTVGPACDGTFSCGYPERCRCGLCCETYYDCENGHLQYFGSGDACQSTTPCDAGASSDASTGVCTPGADQTCNDNPAVSSIHGHCTDAGTCICNVGAGHNPESGKCL